MAEYSYFFNATHVSENGKEADIEYNANDFCKYFATVLSNGIFYKSSDVCQIVANGSAMTVTELIGEANINGHFYRNTTNLILPIDIADGKLDRIDLIVLRLEQTKIKAYVKKGTFASSPVAPVVERDSDYYEIALAEVRVNHGATSISQSNIRDIRLDNNVCGIVTGLLQQLDTSTFLVQFETELREKLGVFYDWFVSWFTNIKNQLSTDAAGHLQLQINDINDLDTASLVKSEKDDCGIYTKLEYKDKFGTAIKTSVLSGGVSPLYTTRTVTYRDGTVIKYTLTYDDDNDLLSEVIVNE